MNQISPLSSTSSNNYFDRFTSDTINHTVSVYNSNKYPKYDNTFRVNIVLPSSVYEVADLAESSCVTTSMINKLIYYDSSSASVTGCDGYPKIILTPNSNNDAYTKIFIGKADG